MKISTKTDIYIYIFKSNDIKIEVKGNRVQEKVFYEKGSVKITDSRFIVGNITYVLANITSVAKGKSNVWVARVLAFIFILFGMQTVGHPRESAIGIFFIILGAVILFFAKRKYIVSLATASGAIMAYTSRNEEEIDTIVKELNNAFVSM